MNIFGTFNFCPSRQFIGGDGGKKDASAGIQAAGEQSYQRSKQTPEEASQYAGSFDIGKLLEQIYGSQMGLNAAPSGYQNDVQQFEQGNPLNKSLYDQTLQDVNNPYGAYESALQPALEQSQNTINQYYQKRGLINSGIAIGQMGTAGVDLAIQEASGKMQARQQALSNANTLSQNIYANRNNNVGNLANLYAGQQSAGLNSLGRQAGAASTAAGYQAYPYQAQLGKAYGGQGALGGALGTVAGAGLGALALGPMGLVPGVGPLAGALVGSALGGSTGNALGSLSN